MVKEQLIYFEPDGKSGGAKRVRRGQDPVLDTFRDISKDVSKRHGRNSEIAQGFKEGVEDLEQMTAEIRDLLKERLGKNQG